MNRNRVGLLLGVVLFALAVPATAQETRATILGTVKDPSGAVVPGVEIVALNVETNTATRATT